MSRLIKMRIVLVLVQLAAISCSQKYVSPTNRFGWPFDVGNMTPESRMALQGFVQNANAQTAYNSQMESQRANERQMQMLRNSQSPAVQYTPSMPRTTTGTVWIPGQAPIQYNSTSY